MAIYDHKIDKSVPIPLYFQLEKIILEQIESKNYQPGDLIPTENELSEFFDISRTTVRQAISNLVHEGHLYRVKSKGTFVSEPKINQDFIKRLETFNEQIRRSGRTPSTQVLALEVVPWPKQLINDVQSMSSDKAIMLYRLRCVDGEPNVIVRTYLPYNLCSFVLDQDFEKMSLYEILSTKNSTRIFKVKRIIEAIAATREDARLLEVKTGSPIHYFSTTGYNEENQPVEFSFAKYRGDKNRFEIEINVQNNNW